MKSLLIASYIVVCFLIIGAVFIQNGKGSQAGVFSPQTSKNLFGASGPKDFLYSMTKWLIFFFFSLALAVTILDTRSQKVIEQQSSWTPLSESSDKN